MIPNQIQNKQNEQAVNPFPQFPQLPPKQTKQQNIPIIPNEQIQKRQPTKQQQLQTMQPIQGIELMKSIPQMKNQLSSMLFQQSQIPGIPQYNAQHQEKLDIECKPKPSPEIETIRQRYKKTQSERKELVKAIHFAYQIIDNFEMEPESSEKAKFAYELIEQACFKLKRGMKGYLEDYVSIRNDITTKTYVDEDEERIITQLSKWTCTGDIRLTKCFDSEKTVFDENNFFESIKNKVNINVVIKDGMGNIFGCHVACAPTQKNLAVVDKTHFIFSLKNVKSPGAAEKQFVPRKAVESFVVFHKSNYVFCVPYAFAIGPYGKSTISPRLERVYTSKDTTYECSFDNINSTTMPDTFPIEWVKVFVQ